MVQLSPVNPHERQDRADATVANRPLFPVHVSPPHWRTAPRAVGSPPRDQADDDEGQRSLAQSCSGRSGPLCRVPSGR